MNFIVKITLAVALGAPTAVLAGAPGAPVSCEAIKNHNWQRENIRPVMNWWDAIRKDNAAMVDPRWIGCPGDTRGPNYHFNRIDGFVYSPDKPQPSGTVALYHWYNAKANDNMLTTHPNYSAPGVTQRGDFRLIGKAGYIYSAKTKKRPGLVPFYTHYSAVIGDAHSTTHPHWDPTDDRWNRGSYSPFRKLEGYLIDVNYR